MWGVRVGVFVIFGAVSYRRSAGRANVAKPSITANPQKGNPEMGRPKGHDLTKGRTFSISRTTQDRSMYRPAKFIGTPRLVSLRAVVLVGKDHNPQARLPANPKTGSRKPAVPASRQKGIAKIKPEPPSADVLRHGPQKNRAVCGKKELPQPGKGPGIGKSPSVSAALPPVVVSVAVVAVPPVGYPVRPPAVKGEPPLGAHPFLDRKSVV